MMKRIAGNRGSFYPQSCGEVEQMIEFFDTQLDTASVNQNILTLKPRMIIVPHAGYMYSGFTANVAYRLLKNAVPKRVVVIGPSHHVYFEGISGSRMHSYETPCGELEIDEAYLQLLSEKHEILFVPEAHNKEHSTETQMPFLKHYCSNAKVLELIYGGHYDFHLLVGIIKDILTDPDNVVVISSDLSHFYAREEAERKDRICLSGMAQRDIGILESGCEACGIIGLKAAVEVAKVYGLRVELLDYRTSADTSGDDQSVVGYMSAAIF